jgi:hypothetical protein
MPAYDNSFIGQIAPYTSYITTVLWYAFCILGIFSFCTIIALPFIMAFYGYKSISLKIKNKKSNKMKKLLKVKEGFEEQIYFKQLTKNPKKKKHS